MSFVRAHAEENDVKFISRPQIGHGIDQLEWPLVRKIIQQEFQTSKFRLTVYILNVAGSEDDSEKVRAVSTENFDSTKIRQAQADDESLKLLKEWARRSRVHRNNELQCSQRLAWQLYNQSHSLYITNNVLCRKFEPTMATFISSNI